MDIEDTILALLQDPNLPMAVRTQALNLLLEGQRRANAGGELLEPMWEELVSDAGRQLQLKGRFVQLPGERTRVVRIMRGVEFARYFVDWRPMGMLDPARMNNELLARSVEIVAQHPNKLTVGRIAASPTGMIWAGMDAELSELLGSTGPQGQADRVRNQFGMTTVGE